MIVRDNKQVKSTVSARLTVYLRRIRAAQLALQYSQRRHYLGMDELTEHPCPRVDILISFFFDSSGHSITVVGVWRDRYCEFGGEHMGYLQLTRVHKASQL